MRATVTAAVALVAATACGSNPAIVVEVRGRPALGEVKRLGITVANAGSTQMQSFDVEGESFRRRSRSPRTGAPARSGVSARLVDDVVTAIGATSVKRAANEGTLLLNPADFVVNTEFAGDQAPNVDIETNGFQITANGGVVTLGFGDDCPVSVCNQYGRRYTADGLPQSTGLGAGTNQFRWNQADGQFAATLAVASQPDGSSLALWDTPTGVSCRAMDPAGDPAGAEVQIAADAGADVVSAVPLANGNYSVAWVADDAATTNRVIRSAVVTTTCGAAIAPFIAAGSISFASRPAIAHAPSGTMIAWIENFEQARFRIGAATGSFSPVGAAQTGTVLISPPGTNTIEFIRPIVGDDGYAIAYHSADFDLTNDRIFFRRASPAGARSAPTRSSPSTSRTRRPRSRAAPSTAPSRSRGRSATPAGTARVAACSSSSCGRAAYPSVRPSTSTPRPSATRTARRSRRPPTASSSRSPTSACPPPTSTSARPARASSTRRTTTPRA